MQDAASLLWAERELGDAELGDKRRSRTLVELLAAKAVNPGKSYSAALGLNREHRASRLFNRPSVHVESVMSSHINRLRERCSEFKEVIGVLDSSHLNFSGHYSLLGIGPIGSKEKPVGLMMHSALVLTPQGTPLGLAGLQLWARDPENFGISNERARRATSQKESNKWLVGLHQLEEAVPKNVHLVVVADRECDIFDVFAARRRANTDLVIRASQLKRLVQEGEIQVQLLQLMRRTSVIGVYTVPVPAARKHPARVARMEMRTRKIHVLAPTSMGAWRKSVKLTAVWVSEIDPPDEESALDWLILTTLAVCDIESGKSVIGYYSRRWTIEEFHKVLKDTLKVEKMQFDDLDSLEPAIATSAIIAQRAVGLTKTAREHSDAPAQSIASDMEIQVLESWLRSTRYKNPEVTTIRDFVRGVAILGGFLARKCDGEPGPKTVGEGLGRLQDLVTGVQLGFNS